MILEENWAVDPNRVRAFFSQQPDAEKIPEGFIVDGCTVTLMEVEGTLLGKWKQLRTYIRIEGEDDAVSALYRRFFLTFVSAGG